MQLQLSLAVADRLHETLLVRGEPLDAVEAVRLLLASPAAPEHICREVLAALVRHDQRFCPGTAGDLLSLKHWEIPDPDLADVPFVALDLETTGSRAGTSKITEIGAVRFEGFREVGRFHTLVNPQRPIPPMITHITGITQEMVADAPRIEEVVPDLLEFLQGAVIVAHNAAFDVGFLNYEFQRLKGRRLGDGAIDTLPLARLLAPGLPNYRLRTVADALGAPVTACHRALADAQAAGHVFVTLAGRLQERGITRLGEARAFVSPNSRSAIDKLSLTRDVPRCPGTYRFVDKHGAVLYVGKADRLRERVRSYFVPGGGHARKVRQAVHLVERIDWDESYTPLEAVVREQELILEHKPPCNVQGSRPENYTYLKVGDTGAGLSLTMTTRQPRWLGIEGPALQPPRSPLIIGPFRGRARIGQALDLLHRCYPIRRCPRGTSLRPCVRLECGHCLAPCAGERSVVEEHDALVTGILQWLGGQTSGGPVEPAERAEELVYSLSRQRRFEEAQRVREARDHLLSLRRSCQSLAEALSLRFAALWPAMGDDGSPELRLNVVWDGRLREAVSLPSSHVAEEIEGRLRALWSGRSTARAWGPDASMAVAQKDLDALLAVRRWYRESEATCVVVFPGSEAALEERERANHRLLAEAWQTLASWPADRAAGSAV
jgi:DNA polymerase III epsilon subunit family exonuclease